MPLGGSPFWCKLPMLWLLCSSAPSLVPLGCPVATPKGGAPAPGRCLLYTVVASFSILLLPSGLRKEEGPGLRRRAWLPTSSEASSPSVPSGPRLLSVPCDITQGQRSEVIQSSPSLRMLGSPPSRPSWLVPQKSRGRGARRPEGAEWAQNKAGQTEEGLRSGGGSAGLSGVGRRCFLRTLRDERCPRLQRQGCLGRAGLSCTDQETPLNSAFQPAFAGTGITKYQGLRALTIFLLDWRPLSLACRWLSRPHSARRPSVHVCVSVS